MEKLKSLSAIPDTDDFISQIFVDEEAQRALFARLYHRGHISEASNRASDLEMTGHIVSAIVESELEVFLRKGRAARKPGEPRNYRNGYVTRTLHMGSEEIPVAMPRDRLGLFKPSFVGTYARDFAPACEDIMAFAVIEGYAREELAIILHEAYLEQKSDGLVIARQMPVLFKALESWLRSPVSPHYRILVGWEHPVKHCSGIEKRIVGVKSLQPDGTLAGIAALACDLDSNENIESRLLHLLHDEMGIQTVGMFFALNHRAAFEAAAGEVWEGVRFPVL